MQVSKAIEPKSIDELVDFIAQSAKTHFERTGRGIDGSVLAYLVRDKYPGLDYVKLGLSKLGDAVRLGIERKVILRNENVRHLEVRPAQSAGFPTSSASAESNRELFVAHGLWRAAVLSTPDSHTFFNRATGELTQATPAELQRKRSDVSLVEVDTISESMQLQWLRGFLQSKGLLDDEREPHLRVLLRGRIRDFDAPVVRDWKFFRARKAVEQVRQWAARNGIPEAMVLEPPNRAARTNRVPVVPQSDEDALRRATLAALSEMTLEELGKLQVPIQHIYRHFAPK